MRLIIAGGRDFTDLDMMTTRLAAILDETMERIVLISGTARGADATGERWAAANGVHVERYPADWNKYGKSAGYKRNTEMAKQATHCVVFWDGKSRGSKHMIDIAGEHKLELRVISYTNLNGRVFQGNERRTK